MKVPMNPVTHARAKKLKEALQVLIRAIQNQIGPYKHIEGIGPDWNELCAR